MTSRDQNQRRWRALLHIPVTGVLSTNLFGWTSQTLTAVLHLTRIKAFVEAMFIEFGPFLRVSCSYQWPDKLVSLPPPLHWATDRTPWSQELTSALFPPLSACGWREATHWLYLSGGYSCSKLKYVVFRSLKQTRKPWHSWRGGQSMGGRVSHSPASRLKCS